MNSKRAKILEQGA